MASNTQTNHHASDETRRFEARRREVAALSEMEGLDLADEEVMARAWRGESRKVAPEARIQSSAPRSASS